MFSTFVSNSKCRLDLTAILFPLTLLVAGLKREVARARLTSKRTVARREVAARGQLGGNCNLANVLTVQNAPLCDSGNNNNDNDNDNDNNNNNNNDTNNDNKNDDNNNVSNFSCCPC